MAVEVHSSLKSFGYVDGGAKTLIGALMQVVENNGSIVMPSFKLSVPQSLSEVDKKLGLTLKIKILKGDEERSGMGIVPDTFRKLPGVYTGQGLFRVSASDRYRWMGVIIRCRYIQLVHHALCIR